MQPQVNAPHKNRTVLAQMIQYFKKHQYVASIITLLLSVGAYALLFPLAFAVGLVAMLLIHEIGHVWAARQKGIPVSVPLFIPFVGALVWMKKRPRDARTEAYIALAGPVAGTLGALVVYGAGIWFQHPLLLVIAKIGFFLNLINLLPMPPLDGGRISAAVTRWLWLVGVAGGLWLVIWFKSLLFFIIWIMLVSQMIIRMLQRKRKDVASAVSKIVLSVDELTLRGAILPGEAHRTELKFVTYSTLDRSQKIRVRWDALGMQEVIRMPEQTQGLIQRVAVTGIEYVPKQNPDKLYVYCQIDYKPYETDEERDVNSPHDAIPPGQHVPISVRLKYGAAYACLGAFLIWMIYAVYQQGIVLWF